MNHFRRLLTGSALALTAAVSTVVGVPGTAVADDQICGYRPYDPQRDGLDLQRFLEDGQGQVNDSLRQALGWGEETCVALRYAVEVAAPYFVPGLHPAMAPFRFFDVKLPNGIKFFMWVKRAYENAAELPRELPAVGAPSITAPVSWTGDQGLWLNSGPGTGARIAVLPDGAVLTILCQTNGPAVDAPYGRTTVWDSVITDTGLSGFVSDGWVNTGTNDRVAPTC